MFNPTRLPGALYAIRAAYMHAQFVATNRGQTNQDRFAAVRGDTPHKGIDILTTADFKNLLTGLTIPARIDSSKANHDRTVTYLRVIGSAFRDQALRPTEKISLQTASDISRLDLIHPTFLDRFAELRGIEPWEIFDVYPCEVIEVLYCESGWHEH